MLRAAPLVVSVGDGRGKTMELRLRSQQRLPSDWQSMGEVEGQRRLSFTHFGPPLLHPTVDPLLEAHTVD